MLSITKVERRVIENYGTEIFPGSKKRKYLKSMIGNFVQTTNSSMLIYFDNDNDKGHAVYFTGDYNQLGSVNRWMKAHPDEVKKIENELFAEEL